MLVINIIIITGMTERRKEEIMICITIVIIGEEEGRNRGGRTEGWKESGEGRKDGRKEGCLVLSSIILLLL